MLNENFLKLVLFIKGTFFSGHQIVHFYSVVFSAKIKYDFILYTTISALIFIFLFFTFVHIHCSKSSIL